MDSRIEKAFAVANYMATLSNQRRILAEEYSQRLTYYTNGAAFKVTPELINFTKMLLELGHTAEVAFIDSNNFPVVISDVQEFFDNIISVHFEAINDYAVKYSELKAKRKVSDIVEL
jgi:uncharacterized protein YqkB